MENIADNNSRIEDLGDSVEVKIVGMDKEIVSQSRVLNRKIEREEVTKLWKYFERFAEYKDLKQLHNIVIPEITKFE